MIILRDPYRSAAETDKKLGKGDTFSPLAIDQHLKNR